MSRAITFLVSGHLDQVRRRWAGRSWAPIGVLTSPAVGIDLAKVVALGCPWAADNGCFGQFDAHAYLRLCARIRQLDRRAFRWLVIPDVVADHRATVRRFLIWYPILRRMGFQPDELAFVLQDGAEAGPLPQQEVLHYFIGGSTAWKESQHPRTIAARIVYGYGKEHGWTIHMGRVNTRRRLATGAGLLRRQRGRHGAAALWQRRARRPAALRPGTGGAAAAAAVRRCTQLVAATRTPSKEGAYERC